jgi:hypothetical protein
MKNRQNIQTRVMKTTNPRIAPKNEKARDGRHGLFRIAVVLEDQVRR